MDFTKWGLSNDYRFAKHSKIISIQNVKKAFLKQGNSGISLNHKVNTLNKCSLNVFLKLFVLF